MEKQNKGADLSTAKGTAVLNIDRKMYKWDEQYITGAQIKGLAGIPLTDQLFLSKKLQEDVLIGDADQVDLYIPGTEHFYSQAKADTKVIIIVNELNYKIEAGLRSVAEIKTVGQVPLGYDLEQLIDGKLTPLKDEAVVEIKGNEIFFGHVKDGSSS
jgi:hypothetical protein